MRIIIMNDDSMMQNVQYISYPYTKQTRMRWKKRKLIQCCGLSFAQRLVIQSVRDKTYWFFKTLSMKSYNLQHNDVVWYGCSMAERTMSIGSRLFLRSPDLIFSKRPPRRLWRVVSRNPNIYLYVCIHTPPSYYTRIWYTSMKLASNNIYEPVNACTEHIFV